MKLSIQHGIAAAICGRCDDHTSDATLREHDESECIPHGRWRFDAFNVADAEPDQPRSTQLEQHDDESRRRRRNTFVITQQ